MLVDHSYKISAFGDFTNIQPTPDNMAFFLEQFKKYNLVPSVFLEMQIDNDTQSSISQQRIAMISLDNSIKISISTNRLDFEITATDDVKLDIKQRSIYNIMACNIFDIIFSRYSKASSRLALNTESLHINLSEQDIQNFMKKYPNPISLYDISSLKDWNTHLMVCKSHKISESDEIFNIITNIKKTKLQKMIGGQPEISNGFSIVVDINTIAEKNIPRFTAAQIDEFINIANIWWDEIINEVDGNI